jgi:hypothetical protein
MKLFDTVKDDMNNDEFKSFFMKNHSYYLDNVAFKTMSLDDNDTTYIWIACTMIESEKTYLADDIVWKEITSSVDHDAYDVINKELKKALDEFMYSYALSFKDEIDTGIPPYITNTFMDPNIVKDMEFDYFRVFMLLYGDTMNI